MTDMRVPYGIETRVQESLRVSIRLVVRGFEIQTNKQTMGLHHDFDYQEIALFDYAHVRCGWRP